MSKFDELENYEREDIACMVTQSFMELYLERFHGDMRQAYDFVCNLFVHALRFEHGDNNELRLHADWLPFAIQDWAVENRSNPEFEEFFDRERR